MPIPNDTYALTLDAGYFTGAALALNTRPATRPRVQPVRQNRRSSIDRTSAEHWAGRYATLLWTLKTAKHALGMGRPDLAAAILGEI